MVVTRFLGEIFDGGLPTEPSQVIVLEIDSRFVFDVRVVEVLDGELPEGWTSPLRFGIHSPALFFRLQGLDTGFGHAPHGRFLFTVWGHPSGQLQLEIAAPAEPPPA